MILWIFTLRDLMKDLKMTNIREKIADRTAEVMIIGAGYVGLPMAVRCAEAGFTTYVYDVSVEKVRSINRGESYIGDVSSQQLSAMVECGKLEAFSSLRDFVPEYNAPPTMTPPDVILVCVPTPLNKRKDPDVSYVLRAAGTIAHNLPMPDEFLVVLESTVYPGFTRESFAPTITIEDDWGKTAHFAFSAERVDPGNEKYNTKNTPKVVGGLTPNCTEVATQFYETIVDKVISVSTAEVSEMTKILENTFRMINIGMANEVALVCRQMGIDVWEVIQAASTKPFGFMPFTPGPGIGGHCIKIDPHYLSWKLKTIQSNMKFIELAEEISSYMPKHIVQLTVDALNSIELSVRGSDILVVGVAYKPNIDDVRESPALDIIEMLEKKGANVHYHDPYVPSVKRGFGELKSCDIERVNPGLICEHWDCSIIVTNHSNIDYQKIINNSECLVDARNALAGFDVHCPIERL